MEIKKTISKYSYRIEAKPGGGFVAYSTDPSVEAIEGPTREEVIQQVEAKISAILGEQFPKLEKLLHSDLKIGGLHMKVDGKVSVTNQSGSGDAQTTLSQPSSSQPGFPAKLFANPFFLYQPSTRQRLHGTDTAG